MKDSKAPRNAHIYYARGDRGRAQTFRVRLIRLKESGEAPQLPFVGNLRDHEVGPHPVPQFEIRFSARLVPPIDGLIREAGPTALIHSLTCEDLADHPSLGQWIGTPIDLDLTVLDPPGVNQEFARFGKRGFWLRRRGQSPTAAIELFEAASNMRPGQRKSPAEAEVRVELLPTGQVRAAETLAECESPDSAPRRRRKPSDLRRRGDSR